MFRRTTRPALENLEARDVPSVTLHSLNNGHTLKISGSADWENVQIVQNDQTNTLEVSYFRMPKANQIMELEVHKAYFVSDAITKIFVDLGQGNDSFSYSLAEGTNATIARQWNITMGAGDDSVNIDTAMTLDHSNPLADAADTSTGFDENPQPLTPDGKPFDPTSADYYYPPDAGIADFPENDHSLILANLGFSLNTGAGDDNVNILLGEVADNAVVRLTMILGDGNDYYSLLSDYDIGAQSKVIVDVNAGSGNDSVAAKMTGSTADGSLVDLIFKGGDGKDIMDAGFYGRLDGQFNLLMLGGNGNDTLSLITDTDPQSQGKMHFKIMGEAGHDCMTYQTLGADDVTLATALIDGGSNRNVARISRDIACINCSDTQHLPPLL